MTAQPSQPRIVWVLGTIALVASVCAVYFAWQAQRFASASEATAQELSAANDELDSAHAQLATARLQTLATASVPPAPTPPPVTAIVTDAPEPSPPRAISPDMRAAFHSPAMREMVRQGHLAVLRPIYDSLVTQLNLSPEERERFYDLQVTVDDPGTGLDKLPAEAGSAEERAQIEEQIRQNEDAALQQLKALLGNEGYQIYNGYRTTQSERMLVQQFRQQADPRLPRISDWQYDRLRDLLIQARSQYPPVNDDYSASYAAALAQAAQILTPDQLASFTKYLQNQQDVRNAMQKVLPPGG
jgi:hypothetical protein